MDKSGRSRIVIANNDEHMPHKLRIWTQYNPQTAWLLAFIATQALEGSVWDFAYSNDDAVVTVLLREKSNPDTFAHHLHVEAQKVGWDTVHCGRPADLEITLKEEHILKH